MEGDLRIGQHGKIHEFNQIPISQIFDINVLGLVVHGQQDLLDRNMLEKWASICTARGGRGGGRRIDVAGHCKKVNETDERILVHSKGKRKTLYLKNKKRANTKHEPLIAPHSSRAAQCRA